MHVTKPAPFNKAARAPRDECDVKRRHEMTHMERGASQTPDASEDRMTLEGAGHHAQMPGT
jgi:hypothetical protein